MCASLLHLDTESLWVWAKLGTCVSVRSLYWPPLLTRIISVITWYHFAFFVILLAMLGMTAGAVLAQRFRAGSRRARSKRARCSR